MTIFSYLPFIFPAGADDRRRPIGAPEVPESRCFCPDTSSLIAALLTDLARPAPQPAVAPRPPTAEIDIAVHR
jgi:hypothetical protein